MGIDYSQMPLAKPTRKRKKNRVRSKATRVTAKMKGELDASSRQRVFERDGFKCVRCGDQRVQWAHIFTRVHLCLRWEEDNALSLCGGCHLWWHKYPLLSVDWFRKNWNERYERIMAVYKINPKVKVVELWRERCGGESL